MTEQINVPKLRFDEFDDKYVETSLENLTKKKISYGIVQAGPHIPDGMPYIKSTNLNKELSLGDLERTSDEIAQSYRRSEVRPADIIFSLRGNIGATRVVPDSIPVANLTQGTARLSIKDSFSNLYVNYCLSTRRLYKRVNSVSKGSTFQEISLGDLRKVKITHASTIEEQQKIASFLSKVDEKITLLTEKKEKLTEYKKGVMQQLFNGKWEERDGQLTFIAPTLRFKADDGSEFPDWENKKLGDFYKNLSTGMTPSRKVAEYFTGENLWITSGELNFGLVGDTKEKITQEAIKDTSLKIYPAGTFFIAITGLEAPGTRGRCAINSVPATTNQSCMAFEKIEAIDTKYLSYWYKHYSEALYCKYAQGTKQQSFNNKLIEGTPIDLPVKTEQIKIAIFLSSLDQKIELVASELDKAKKWKKGLLQQMFV